MEDNLPKMIPTRYRRKISRAFSYVVGAKVISLAWQDVPQFELLKLSFSLSNAFKGERLIFRVTYRSREVNQFSSHMMEDHGWYGPLWEVTVGGCHREDAHEIREWLREVGLPQSREWLHNSASPHGEDIYLHWSASFDEETRLFSVTHNQ